MPDRRGPAYGNRFTVEVQGQELQGVRKVEIPSRTTETGEYREGDEPDYEKKLLGDTTFGTLTIERSIQPDDSTVFDWAELGRMGDVDGARKECEVTLEDEEGSPEITWRFENAWVQHYDPPTLDVDSEDPIGEMAVIAFDKMVREYID